MFSASLAGRFREALGASAEATAEDVSFAVAFTTLLGRVLPEDVSLSAREAMRDAVVARTRLDERAADLLIDLALAPESRAVVRPQELRAFGHRFGLAEQEALRVALAEDLDLASFADQYGSAEALLLLDSLFAVAAVDGVIDRQEIGRLQQMARDLGVDPVLVGALFRKHDHRHASGDLSFPLDKDRFVVGRSSAAPIQLPDPQVAPRHAELVREGDGWRIVDLGSGRPTVVNGNAVASAPLRPGDVVRVGPYTLSLDRDGHTLKAFGAKAFSALSMRDLKRSIGATTLLDGVGFTVFSGEVVAMVGPSGAGKTTLLNAIAGIAPADSGRVLLDGHDFHSLLANDRSIVGIVPQDDVVHPELTVEEALFYSARLRFPKDVDRGAIQDRVDRVLEELGISHIRHSRIGDAVRRGISGGQRKRVNLGQELLTQSTRVLFLDEPTSGLDPQTAQDIVSLVRQLADDGRIVFLVTHDVTPSVLSMVDHLLVLAPGGRVAWFGPPDQACAWFGVASADQIFARLPDHTPVEWATKYKEGPAWRKFVRTREHVLGLDSLGGERSAAVAARPTMKPPPRRARRSGLLEVGTLTARYAKVKVRDTWGTSILLAQAPILAIAMIIVFPEPDTAMLFMLALSCFWFGASGTVRELIAERAIWRREARVGLGVVSYMTSKVIVLGAMVAFQSSLLAGLVWLCLGMGGEYQYDPLVLLALATLTGWVGMALGLMISSMFASSVAAVGSLPLWIIPQITFGGLIVKVKDMGVAAKAISWTMVIRYAFEGLIKAGEKLSVPGDRGKDTEIEPIKSPLWSLGFRTSDDYDLGLSWLALIGVLGGFFAVFLSVATVLTSRARKGS